jgi:two-component system cell cycle sensor histidine kinase/response regulator CckA
VEDRRRAEEALRTTEERFHALYNKMNEGVCLQEVLFDETGRAVDYMVLDVNPSYESILGLPVDIVVGKRGSELFNTEDPPFLSIYADVAVTERHTTFDSYYPPARRHFRVSAFSPQTGKVAAIFSDITESKERMDELKTSEGKFRILFENAPDAMYLNDLSGVFIEGNAQVERLTGYRIRELIGESLLKVGLLPIEQTLKAANNISLSAQGRATGPDEFTLIRKDGTHVQAEISTHPVKVDGQTLALSIARDITERKQKEAAVRESEERFRMVYESMGCGVIISDLNGNIQQVNHPVVNMLGYVNKEEMTGIHASLFIAEEDRRAASEDMMTALQTSERLTKEFQLVKRGGDVVNCEVDLDLLRAKDGSAAGFVILVRDVTDRRKDRQVMLDDVDTYKSLLEGLEEAVFRVGLPLGKYDYVSPAVKRVFGYASEEFLKNPLLMRKIVHPDFGRYFNEMWKDLIQGHIQPSYEYKVMDRDGTERWVFQSNRRVFNQSGKVTAIEGVWRDITEQKQADDTLRENEEQFRTMFELSSTAIEFYDSAYRLVHANRACLELFGVEDVGDLRKYNLITDHRTPEGVRRKLKENLSAEWETSLDLAETPGEGPHERSPRLVHLEVVVSPVEMGKGSPEWYLAEIRDIGKRKEHEKRRGQFEGLESATRIARAVARELNNVLTGVMGYSEHLAGELADNESLRSEAEEIKKAAEGVMARSRQLLRFSRSLPLKSEPLDLNSVISGAEGRIAHLLGEDKTLRINLKPSLDEVRADAEQIETILLNLASNAKDAMRSGDTLAIATDMVDIDSVPQDAPDGARPGHFVRLTVSDSGSGMDEETKCHILEPFFTTRGTSAGMGLSVVYGSIRQHGGWIDISSEPGAGTVCSVYLPAEKTAVRKEAAGVGSLDGGGERILLVEDDEIVRVMAAKVLRDKGYVVFPAADAGEAKSVFDSENHEFHLVFCDIVLPDRNGMELCDELVSARPGLKVLLTSGYTDRQTQLDSIGGRDFPLLEKPYALFDLLSALKETLAAGSGAGIL